MNDAKKQGEEHENRISLASTMAESLSPTCFEAGEDLEFTRQEKRIADFKLIKKLYANEHNWIYLAEEYDSNELWVLKIVSNQAD